jgi:hypothetical protein
MIRAELGRIPMAPDHTQHIDLRIAGIERQCRQLRMAFVLVLAGALTLSAAWTTRTAAQQPQSPQLLRVRTLIVEDEAGQPRVVIGAPIPQSSGRVGLRINDDRGAERLGMSLQQNGNMVLGLDAPLGTNTEGSNRERITLVADQQGGAYIRFLDRRTGEAARIYLDPENRVWTQFSDFAQKPPLIKRIGLSGEEVIRPTPDEPVRR